MLDVLLYEIKIDLLIDWGTDFISNTFPFLSTEAKLVITTAAKIQTIERIKAIALESFRDPG